MDTLITTLNTEHDVVDFSEKSREIFSDVSFNLLSWSPNYDDNNYDKLPPDVESGPGVQDMFWSKWSSLYFERRHVRFKSFGVVVQL